MTTFDSLGLKPEILQGVQALGFETPSPIQEAVIPYVLEHGGDVIGLAQTGTGKTAAFGLPLLQTLDTERPETQALVLSPTRELCVQIAGELVKYAAHMPGVRVVAVYGGEDIRRQLKQLDRAPHILVATPGRLLDLIGRGKVHLNSVNRLVLDEADEMLHMGFIDDINEILSQLPEERDTMLFSATMPPEIAQIAKRYMHDAREIVAGTRGEAASKVLHQYVIFPREARFETLKRLLDCHPDIYGIVFCRTRQETKDVADGLMAAGYNADALHGDLTQVARDSVMNRFRVRNLQILVATDVAARGLDVNDLTHVIHYNLPGDPETYTHRSGRTGRVGKEGVSIALISPRERRAIAAIEKKIHREFTQIPIPTGLEICQRQMLHWAERIRSTEAKPLMDPYMQPVNDLLQDLTKEEIVRRFMTIEAGRFVDSYHDAADLNERKEKKERQPQPEGKRGRVREFADEVRLKINRGRNDHFEPKRLLGLINDVTGDRTIAVGNIDVAPRFTFFSVRKKDVSRIYDAFSTHERTRGIHLGDVKGDRKARRDDDAPRPDVPHRYESRGAKRKK